MKKRQEEILRNKEQFTEQSTVHSKDTYIYGVGILAVLAIGVCVFFAYSKKAGQHEEPIKPKISYML